MAITCIAAPQVDAIAISATGSRRIFALIRVTTFALVAVDGLEAAMTVAPAWAINGQKLSHSRHILIELRK